MTSTNNWDSDASEDCDYVFDNEGEQAGARFDALRAMFDAGTIRHIEERGIRDGWKCLEIGAGGGSVAAWLAGRVGPAGHVLATDIDTRFLETLHQPNLEVRRHNIASDPLPEAAFDLAHARLVLMHLPEARKALQRIAAALKPDGWLVVEEFDAVSISPDPETNPIEVELKTTKALRRVEQERGVNLCYGRLLCGEFRAIGLADVESEGRILMCQGRSVGASLMRANYEQLRSAILASGLVTEEEFERDLASLNEPEFLAPSPMMWSAWGRRPA
jgi:SAM-dependent methyltransferase